MTEQTVLWSATYSDVDDALADLKAFQDLHDAELVGDYDAAVIGKQDGKPHIVKRVDRPRIRVIAETFGGGNLPRNELHDAAEDLGEDEVALIVVGEPTLQRGWDKAVTRGAQVIKREFDAQTDRLAQELRGSSKA